MKEANMVDPVEARRGIDALFPGCEQNQALQNAFRAHPDSVKYFERVPDLGARIPWVLVTCFEAAREITGIIVGGVAARHGWDIGLPFTVFTLDRQPAGSFVPVDPLTWSVHVIGTIPGTVRHSDRPDAITLLAELSALTIAWAADLNLTKIWNDGFNRKGNKPFPDCFLELHDNLTVFRGLVVNGESDAAGGWDFNRPIMLMIAPDNIIVVDPSRADWVEVINDRDSTFCRR